MINYLEEDHISKPDLAAPKSEAKGISLMNMLLPLFTMNGSIKGVYMREEMAPLLFVESDYSFEQLRRVIRTCIQINRIIRDGLTQDFNLVSVQVPEIKGEDLAHIKEP